MKSAHSSLTPEELKSFEEFYERRLIEACGSRNYEEDAEITAEMLRAVREDGMTPTADGGVSFVRRGGLDWTDPAAIDAAQVASGRKAATATVKGGGEGGVRDMVTGVAVLVALVVGAVWWFGFRGDAGKAEGTGTPVAEETVVSGEEAGGTPTPIPTLESDLLANIVDGGVKTGLVAPRTLEIKGVSFVVQAVEIEGGDWPLPDDPRAVSWVYGTVVNYVMGIGNTPENRALLASLRSGDELLLRMSTGPAYRFAYADIVRVAPQASEVFRQNRPGLTLALVGGEGEEEMSEADRIIVRAVYLPDSELGSTRIDDAIGAPGRPVQLGDALTVTALKSYPLPQASTIPDTVYLAVDYEIANTGNRPVGTASFQHRVEAEGTAYAVAVGVPGKVNPPLPVAIQAGQAVTATAVYAIPEAAVRTGVIWFFSPALESGLSARVALPAYNGPLEAEVGIGMARLEGGGLVAMVDCYAPLEALTLSAETIQVTGGVLDPARSNLPWRVEAGERRQFALYLQSVGNPVQVIVSGRIFEITHP